MSRGFSAAYILAFDWAHTWLGKLGDAQDAYATSLRAWAVRPKVLPAPSRYLEQMLRDRAPLRRPPAARPVRARSSGRRRR